ncbi:MAG TPA: hypothetical protein VIM10_15005 [Actinopolymorphaceae bacterium]|jgi:hypothetical protein
MNVDDGSNDATEAYLGQLLVSLPGSPRRVRHTVAEIEAHLYDAARRARHDGLDDAAAGTAAVASIGPIAGITERQRPRLWPTPARRRRLVLGVLLIGGVAGLAIGLAGLMGWGVRAIWGDQALATPFPTGSYTAADYARWMRNEPGPADCVTAITADNADDFLFNAAESAVLGIVVLAAYVPLRRRWRSIDVARALPPGGEEVAGAVVAGLVTVFLPFRARRVRERPLMSKAG